MYKIDGTRLQGIHGEIFQAYYAQVDFSHRVVLE
jgi:hypothetical protein